MPSISSATFLRLANMVDKAGSADTDIAFEFLFIGTAGTATVEVKNTDDLVFVDPDNGTVTVALDAGGTGAGSAKTAGDIEDLIETQTSPTLPGWSVIRRCPRSTLLYATNTKLLVAAATDAAQLTKPGGAKTFWKTDNIVARRLCLGNQTRLIDTNNKTRSFWSKRFWNTIDVHRDPIENNLGGSGHAMTYPYATKIDSVYAKATAVGGYTVTVTSCYKDRDGDAAGLKGTESWTAASAAQLFLDEQLDEWITLNGGFIFIELLGAAAISGVEFSAKGSQGALS